MSELRFDLLEVIHRPNQSSEYKWAKHLVFDREELVNILYNMAEFIQPEYRGLCYAFSKAVLDYHETTRDKNLMIDNLYDVFASMDMYYVLSPRDEDQEGDSAYWFPLRSYTSAEAVEYRLTALGFMIAMIESGEPL